MAEEVAVVAPAWRRLLAPLCAAALLWACGLARADSLDGFIRQQLVRQQVPGVAVAVLKNGKPVLWRGYGWADLERRVRATPETLFEIGSVTKQFTAVALMLLVEQGSLKLDDRIEAHLGHLAGLPTAWHGITLRQLLHHTSGIADYEEVMGYVGYRQVMTPEQVIAVVAAKPLDFAPGERWNYSNTGYYLLTLVIEKASGQRYIDFLQQRVLGPAGMARTGSSEPTRVLPGRAAGYEFTPQGRLENRDAIQPSATGGAGMLVSTLADLARWETVLDRRALLRPESWQLLWTEARLNDGGPTGYGMGWFTEPARGRPMLEHSGGTPGFTVQVRRLPQDHLTVIVLGNAYSASGVIDIAGHLARRYLPALRYSPIADTEPANAERLRNFLLRRTDPQPYAQALAPAMTTTINEWWPARLPYFRALGPPLRLELVERDDSGPRPWLRYRVHYADTARLVRVRFDAAGLIDGMSSETE